MENIQSFDNFNEKKWIKDAIKHPGSLRKSLGKKEGEKITQKEISSELSKLKKKDRDKDKPGLQLGERDKAKHKKLTLARTLKSMKENNEFDEEQPFFHDSGMSIEEKASRYDEIESKMAEFYDEDKVDNNTDLLTIGEWIATYMGYL